MLQQSTTALAGADFTNWQMDLRPVELSCRFQSLTVVLTSLLTAITVLRKKQRVSMRETGKINKLQRITH